MIPLPIALLALLYGVVAATSGAALWQVVIGRSAQSFVWPSLWLTLSSGAMCGLALLRSWGRRMAVWTSALLTATTLATAALFVSAGRPGLALVVTFSVICHVLAIRYLQRPIVRALFAANRDSPVRG